MSVHISYVRKCLSKREMNGVEAYARLYGCGGDVYAIVDAAINRPMPAGVGRMTRHRIITKLSAELLFAAIVKKTEKKYEPVVKECFTTDGDLLRDGTKMVGEVQP